MNTTLKTTLRLSPIGLIASTILVVGCIAPAAGAGANAAVPADTNQVSRTASQQTIDQWGHIGHKTPELVMDQWGHISER
jgi:hypothetical protein